jgi:hypothetical protein
MEDTTMTKMNELVHKSLNTGRRQKDENGNLAELAKKHANSRDRTRDL